jgi:hypothetical protein
MGLPYTKSNNSITLTNNQTINYNLGRSFVGWDIDYTIQNPTNGSNTINIQKSSAQNLIYSNGVPNPSEMLFMCSFGLSANSFAYFLQDENYNLWQQTCSVSGNNYNCSLIANYTLTGPLSKIVMQKIIGNTITIVGLAIHNAATIQFFNYYNLSINFTATLGGYLTDIEIVGDYAIIAMS